PKFPIWKNAFYTARAALIPVSLLLMLIGCATTEKRSPATTFDLRQFGAVGDGKTSDTAAFQKALDAARGGELVVPAGNYLLGSVVIPSDTTLRFEKGVTITGTPDKADYPVRTI